MQLLSIMCPPALGLQASAVLQRRDKIDTPDLPCRSFSEAKAGRQTILKNSLESPALYRVNSLSEEIVA
jgi:hypothetical protein